MKVLMLPHLEQLGKRTDGIARVIEAYFKYLPEFGVELVALGDKDYDIAAVHAGATGAQCDVAHVHGLHWTAEHDTEKWEFKSNKYVVDAVRHAKMVTVPSTWVAETFQRDMHLSPTVIPHGIDWQDWIGGAENKGYVLWNKNRDYDVCDPTPVQQLAERFPTVPFVSTFRPRGSNAISNLRVTGLIPHDEMKKAIQRCAVYLSTTKETFGIGILEAMASGKPVLGYRHGGIVDIVEHGTNGYLARPNDFDDLMEGLHFCLKHQQTLGENSREMAKSWPWRRAAEAVANVYRQAQVITTQEPTVTVVIPVYNKSDREVSRAVESARKQDYQQLTDIVVVDDGSEDVAVAEKVTNEIREQDKRVHLVRQENAGVAHARNRGIAETGTKYLCCLDADDWIEPTFLGACIDALENNQSLGMAYTSLYYHKPDGEEGLSPWPGQFNYDRQLIRQNQVPTCCVFRREMWERLGGYRQRYAPKGAGAEDAEFWLRAGAMGWGAQKVSKSALFHYSWQSGIVSSDPTYKEVDWTMWHPWAGRHEKNLGDRGHLFASLATAKKQSHPVRYYDEPIISVIIPVGPGHEKAVVDALDSLEAQQFRHWEAIVVWDTGEPVPGELLKSHPYIRLLETNHKGPGYARNRGAEMARAPFVLFLDADDWLYPECMTRMLLSWQRDASIVYTDYVGKAMVKDVTKLTPEMQQQVYDHDGDEAVIGFRAAEFDCERVMRQPEVPPFVFCNVTALIPKIWHDGIGGFDERMPSWEDVDYHWRLARAGHCYVRLPEELMVYRFYTGSRRDRGLQMHESLVKYIQDKYAQEEAVGCSGCGGRGAAVPSRIAPAPTMRVAQSNTDGKPIVMNSLVGGQMELRDEDVIRARYRVPRRGDHRVIGPMSQIDYGYRQASDIFLIHRNDMQSGWFEEVGAQVVEELPLAPAAPLPPPKITGEQLAEEGQVSPEQDMEIPGFITQPGGTEEVEPIGEPEGTLPAPLPIGEPPDLFSPADMTVQQVRETITSGVVSSAMARTMLEIERDGKNRKTVIGLLEAKL